MFIASTVNATSRSGNDVPVFVLKYGEESCLVKVPFTYEDLKDLTRRAFGIGNSSTNFMFRTSTLDICQGRTVRIHESAWESVRSFVAELQVSIPDSKGPDTTKHISFEEAQPIPSSSKVHESNNQGLSHEVSQDREKSDDIEYEDFVEDKDEVERLAAMSSFPGSAANSDDEHELHVSKRGVSNKSAALVHHLTDQDDEDDVASMTAHHIKTEPARSQRISDELSGYVDRDLSDFGNDPESQTDGQVADRPMRTEPLSARGLPVTGSEGVIGSSRKQTQFDAEDEAPKYVVNIAYPPTGDESMFKTRGTYSVGKVLAGACKTLGVDFNHAHLKLIVDVEDKGGGILSDCHDSDTMAKAGSVAGSRFIIVLDED